MCRNRRSRPLGSHSRISSLDAQNIHASKRKLSHDSFRADPGTDKQQPNAVAVDARRIKLPVIGWVKMRETVRFVGPINSATVARVADRWFVSLTVESITRHNFANPCERRC